MSEWRYLDSRSKALANQGLKLEFASHSDAVLGRVVLNRLEALADLARLMYEKRLRHGEQWRQWLRDFEAVDNSNVNVKLPEIG